MSDLSLSKKMLCAGSAACVADVLTFPFDVAKVRLQIAQNSANDAAKNGLFSTLFKIAKTEGIKSWWNGIVPGLQRQCVFASIRIGLYDSTKSFYSDLFKAGELRLCYEMSSMVPNGQFGLQIL